MHRDQTSSTLGAEGRGLAPFNLQRKTEAGPGDSGQVGPSCSRLDPSVLDVSCP